MAEAIELLLSGNSPAPGPVPQGLAEALAVLEQRVVRLEQGPPAAAPAAPAEPGKAVEQVAHAHLLQALPDRRLTPAEAEGLFTCPQVAELLQLKTPSSITNWIARGNGPGAVYRGWLLLGKGLLPNAQQPGWLFRPTN